MANFCDAVGERDASLFADDGDEDKSTTLPLLPSSTAEEEAHLSASALVNPSDADEQWLVDRLNLRLRQFNGECLYDVGVAEHSDEAGLSMDDLTKAEENLAKIAERCECAVTLLRRRDVGHEMHCSDWLIRQKPTDDDFIEVRVAVVGNVDAGKSTLLGVLTHGSLDNGRGFARRRLFRHKHEIESGRTSSVGNDILGYGVHGNVVNDPNPHDGRLDWTKLCQTAAKVVTFIDLAGHERYLKTTIFGMTGHLPHYCMLMVGANAGVIGTAKEHLGLALALNVPVFVVITKIDMCPQPVLNETLTLLQKLLKSPGCRKLPVTVSTVDDVVVSALNFTSERICPVFHVSNVTGENLDLLRMFLNLLTVRTMSSDDAPAEFQIDDTYWVDGVGAVVSGTCLQGTIKLDDKMLLGPDSIGQFVPVPIKSIHRKRLPVTKMHAGQTASFALRKFKKKDVRKGMVLVSPTLNPKACWEFDAEILVLHHPTTISVKYQAMVHCGPIRQTATIVTMSQECLRTGDKALCRFRFIKHPEYVRDGTKLVFREGRTKAVGQVVTTFPHISAVAQANMAKQHKKQMHGVSSASSAQKKKQRYADYKNNLNRAKEQETTVVEPLTEPPTPAATTEEEKK